MPCLDYAAATASNVSFTKIDFPHFHPKKKCLHSSLQILHSTSNNFAHYHQDKKLKITFLFYGWKITEVTAIYEISTHASAGT